MDAHQLQKAGLKRKHIVRCLNLFEREDIDAEALSYFVTDNQVELLAKEGGVPTATMVKIFTSGPHTLHNMHNRTIYLTRIAQ